MDAANAHARLTGLPAAPAAPAASEEEATTQAASGSDTDDGELPRAAAPCARMSEVDSLLSRLGMADDDGVTSALVPQKRATG